MLLSRYGFREWLHFTVEAALAATIFILLGWWWAVAVVAVIWLALVAFFRDPMRRLPRDLPTGAMLSPADGKVTKVFRVDEHEATAGPAVVIRIFLSVLDVHINRCPFDGEVVDLKYTTGQFHDARSALSAEENECNLITLKIATGETIGVRQVAGKIAQRIVCPLTRGDQLKRGEKFGMIKFGSTTELILPRPDEVTVRVCEGEKVKAGLTILAVLPQSEPRP